MFLVTVGRKPNTEGWGLENMAVDMAGRFVKSRRPMPHVDEERLRRRRPRRRTDAGTQKPRPKRKWSPELIAGYKRRFAPRRHRRRLLHRTRNRQSPASSPAEARKPKAKKQSWANSRFAANGRAMSMDSADNGGFVRVIARKDDHRILRSSRRRPRQRTVGRIRTGIRDGRAP